MTESNENPMPEVDGPPGELGAPDNAESDAMALSSSEDLDEDQLGLDPLEEGVEPPERWAAADQYGTTPYEQHHGEDLEQRLSQERPDFDASEPQTPLDTEVRSGGPASLDDIPEGEGAQVSSSADARTPAEDVNQSADNAGGSVAESLRDPEEGALE